MQVNAAACGWHDPMRAQARTWVSSGSEYVALTMLRATLLSRWLKGYRPMSIANRITPTLHKSAACMRSTQSGMGRRQAVGELLAL